MQNISPDTNEEVNCIDHSITVLCSTMVNETIQYYTENGGSPVYLLLLDATKAFDKVSFKVLFDVLLDKNVCPRIVNLLYYMYTNQLCHVRWGEEKSASFGISNGVKQGGVSHRYCLACI